MRTALAWALAVPIALATLALAVLFLPVRVVLQSVSAAWVRAGEWADAFRSFWYNATDLSLPRAES